MDDFRIQELIRKAEDIISDPKRTMAVTVGFGAVLLTLIGFDSTATEEPPDGVHVAFASQDVRGDRPRDAISGSMMASYGDSTKPMSTDATPEDATMDQRKEAAAKVEKADDDSHWEAPVDDGAAASEFGARGGPVAQEAAWLSGSSGGFAGTGGPGGESGVFAGVGVASGRRGGAESLNSDGTVSGQRTLQGTRDSARMVSAIRSGGGSVVAAVRGVIEAGAIRTQTGQFGPAGNSGNVFGTSDGAQGVYGALGGQGSSFDGEGMKSINGGSAGGVNSEQLGPNPGNLGSSSSRETPQPTTGSSSSAATPKTKAQIKREANRVKAIAKAWRTNVAKPILAEERSDFVRLLRRVPEARTSLIKAARALDAAATAYVAVPGAAASLAEMAEGVREADVQLGQGGAALVDATAGIKAEKLPSECKKKAESLNRTPEGLAEDPEGILEAHRAATSALRRIAAAKMGLDALVDQFKAGRASHEAAAAAAGPVAGAAFAKDMARIEKRLSGAAEKIPYSLYIGKKKGKSAGGKKGLKKLVSVQKGAVKGARDIAQKETDIKGGHRSYPQTSDLQATEDSIWRAKEAALRLSAPRGEDGPLLKQAEVFLPPLVKAGEDAAETHMELCGAYAGLMRLRTDVK